MLTSKESKIIYLSAKDQELIDLPFVKSVPWNNFGRKNIGFLYAISQGADTIYDFDDDNSVSIAYKFARLH